MRQGLIIGGSNNDCYWYKDDLLHREDGPAVEFSLSGSKEWYKNGKLHRVDGPAVVYSAGNKWCYEGKWIKEVSSQEEFEQWLKYKVFL